MNKDEVISKTIEYVKAKLSEDLSAGHDWWHVYRVWRNAKYIAIRLLILMFLSLPTLLNIVTY